MIFECHGHIILNGISYKSAIAHHQRGVDEAYVRCNLKTIADHGIVYYRDGGDKHGVSVFAKQIAGEYGIDYTTSAYIIHKKGHYGHMFGCCFEDMHEYLELVNNAAQLGADFIKLTASGLLDFSNGGTVTGLHLDLRELSMMVDIAHSEGLAVMIHANGADNIKRAAEAGVDSIEHGYYMDNAALQIMAQTGAIWVPTCVTAANLIESGKYDDDVLHDIIDSHKKALVEAVRCGVTVACGSDAGAACVFQGSGTLDELKILESLGIDPYEGNRRIAETFKRR